MLVTQSSPTLCDSMVCSAPGSSVHGILQERIVEWVAISISRGSFWPRNLTQVSRTAGRLFTGLVTREFLCFEILWWFFPYISMNWPQEYMCPHPPEPPLTSFPTLSLLVSKWSNVTSHLPQNTFYISGGENFRCSPWPSGERFWEGERLLMPLKSCQREDASAHLPWLYSMVKSLRVISPTDIALASIINSILQPQLQFAHIWRPEALPWRLPQLHEQV